MKLSILIGSYNRLELFRRTLYAVSVRPPSIPFELIVVDDGSTEDIVGELRKYQYSWKFISLDMGRFYAQTGYTKYYNSPCVSYQIGYQHAEGDLIGQMGNEIIPIDQCFDWLISDLPKVEYAWSVSKTYDLRGGALKRLDKYGSNVDYFTLSQSLPYVLSNENNVPNYLSIFTRPVWEITKGYDWRYLAGVGAEDSDFIRRCFAIPGFKYCRSQAVGLHQFHGGASHLGPSIPLGVDKDWFLKGVAINRKLYESWDGKVELAVNWPLGDFVKQIISS